MKSGWIEGQVFKTLFIRCFEDVIQLVDKDTIYLRSIRVEEYEQYL